jgi:hypothetical protein
VDSIALFYDHGPLSKSGSPQRRTCLLAGRENAKVDSFQLSAPFLLPFLLTAGEELDPSALFAPLR